MTLTYTKLAADGSDLPADAAALAGALLLLALAIAARATRTTT